MSIVFVPKIAFSFDALRTTDVTRKPTSPKALRQYNSWTDRDLTLLVNLKAIGMSYRNIAKTLHKSQDSCSVAMSRNELQSTYKDIQAKMVTEIMGYSDTVTY
jgi:hypothetical protein